MKGIIMKTITVTALGAKCEQCGSEIDLMVLFTAAPICGKCTRKNHKEATK